MSEATDLLQRLIPQWWIDMRNGRQIRLEVAERGSCSFVVERSDYEHPPPEPEKDEPSTCSLTWYPETELGATPAGDWPDSGTNTQDGSE